MSQSDRPVSWLSAQARTFAPIGIAFSIGATVGPAIGGVLATNFGLQPTFYAIGGLFAGLAVASTYGLSETLVKRPPSPRADTANQEAAHDDGSAVDQIKAEVRSWAPLMKIPEVGEVRANVGFWGVGDCVLCLFWDSNAQPYAVLRLSSLPLLMRGVTRGGGGRGYLSSSQI